MIFEPAFLEAAHKHCDCNRAEIETSNLCGCFFCLATFPSNDVSEWLNPLGSGQRTGPVAVSEKSTAFCPKCMIDSVIGDASKLPVADPEFLVAMQVRWFGPMGKLDVAN